MNKFFKRILPATILATCCTVSVFSMTACNEGKDYSDDFAKLQQQIETLKTQNGSNLAEISKLEQQLENLKTNNESNLAEIGKLQQQINNQKLLIESLQSAVNTEPKIYKIGETFTYSYQGIDYFSLTFKDKNHIEITNLNMIGSKISEYIRVKAIESDGRSSILSYSDKILVKNETYSLSLKIFNAVTTYLIGFPLPDSGLMPYVIVDITASI